MLGCSTVCPNCKHGFQCCPPHHGGGSNIRRSMLALTGGGLVTTLSAPNSCSALSPQASPSVPLSFVLPPALGPLMPPALATAPESDLKRLATAVRTLRLSGWYYEGVSYDRGHELLKSAVIGSFLVRDSSDPKFLFSLSVRTDRGPTSVRLHYADGYFRLDAQPHLQPGMPLFTGVVELVQHYVEQSRLCRNNPQVWVDSVGKWHSPILLDKPLPRHVAPLKHLSRLAVHRALRHSGLPRLPILPAPHTRLDLPQTLTAYLAEYPFSL